MEFNLPLHSQMSCMCTAGGASVGKKNTQKKPQEMH